MSENEDKINKPKHYTYSNYEPIEVMESISNEFFDVKSFYYGNIIKYISRANYKNGLEDLKKAEFYLLRLISYFELFEEETFTVPRKYPRTLMLAIDDWNLSRNLSQCLRLVNFSIKMTSIDPLLIAKDFLSNAIEEQERLQESVDDKVVAVEPVNLEIEVRARQEREEWTFFKNLKNKLKSFLRRFLK